MENIQQEVKRKVIVSKYYCDKTHSHKKKLVFVKPTDNEYAKGVNLQCPKPE